MTRKHEDREIGAHRYRVTQLKVRQAHAVLTRIAKVMGGGLGEIASGLGEGDAAKAAIGDLSKEGIGSALARFTRDLGEEDLNWLVDKIRPCVQVETTTAGQFAIITEDHWDDLFAGNLLDEFKLMAFALELNFASFFAGADGVKTFVERLVTPSDTSKSNPPKTQTIGSGV